MEAEALSCPTERRISQPAADRRRTAASATTSGSHVWDGRLVKSQAAVLFFGYFTDLSAWARHPEKADGLGVFQAGCSLSTLHTGAIRQFDRLG